MAALLASLVGITNADLTTMLDESPVSSERMLNVFSQDRSPDMVAYHLEAPQVLCRFYAGRGPRLRVA